MDIFRESAYLLDFLLSKPSVSQHHLDWLWNKIYNDCREWLTNTTEHDKQLVAGTVFMVVRATLAHHYESCYCETICDQLTSTLESKLEGCDEKELAEFLDRLREQSPQLCEWINSYDEADEWLSDQIADNLRSSKGSKDSFRPSGKTFTKTSLLTDVLIDIIGQRLTQANKLDTSPDDWRKLFSGIDQQFTMMWLGKPGELRDLFKMLTNKNNAYAIPNHGYQQILKSHFVDEEGNRLNNIHGDKSIKSFQLVIDDCAFLLQHLTDNVTAMMRQLIIANEGALRDEGYFDPMQAAKQAGMTIRKKRR